MQRPGEDRLIADLAHFKRLLSDSFQFCVFIGLQVSKYLGKDTNIFKELLSTVDEANKIGQAYSKKLQEDKVYDKFRK